MIRRIGVDLQLMSTRKIVCHVSFLMLYLQLKPNLGVNFFVIFQDVLWLDTSFFYMLLESLGLDTRCSRHAYSFRLMRYLVFGHQEPVSNLWLLRVDGHYFACLILYDSSCFQK